MDVTGRRIVIIGGGSGIGEATGRLFAAQGGEVFLVGRDAQKLEKAAADMPGTVHTRQADATSREQLDALFAAVGEFDHLVLAASSSKGAGEFATLDLAEVRAGLDAKVFSHLGSLQAALPTLRKDGSVVFITAASAQAALAGTAGLAAINGALEAVVPPLATELAPLRVNAISPGVIDTPWWSHVPEEQRKALFDSLCQTLPAGRVGRPEEIAQAIFLLATNPYITGTVLQAAGGAHLATGR